MLFISKPILIYCLLFVAYQSSYAQNLLANGGFEDENICTEYKENCTPEAWIATSLFANYYFDASREPAMKHMKVHTTWGLYCRQPVQKGRTEFFVRGRLLCGLQAGHRYKLVMWLYAQDNILDSIGVYFSEQDFLYEKRVFKSIDPQLWSRDGMSTSNEGFWKVEWLYIPQMARKAILPSVVLNGMITTSIRYTQYRNDYYFFLDEVSLTPVDPREKLCFQVDSI